MRKICPKCDGTSTVILNRLENVCTECKEVFPDLIQQTELDTLRAENGRLGREVHSLRVGNQDAQAVISRQAGMLADLRSQLAKLTRNACD